MIVCIVKQVSVGVTPRVLTLLGDSVTTFITEVSLTVNIT